MSIIGRDFKKILIEKYEKNDLGIVALYILDTKNYGYYNYLEVEYTEAQFKEANITANSIRGEWDSDKLIEYYEEKLLNVYGFKMELLTFKHNKKTIYISIAVSLCNQKILFMSTLFNKKAKIILLDYQATLVTNFSESYPYRNGRYLEWVTQHERLSNHLRDLMISGDYYVILITARSTKYMKATMAKIHKELNWLPNEYYFNEHQESPPAAKLKILKNFILNRFDKSDMIALESNIETRKMYKQNGIFAVRYEPSWTEIPTIPNNQ